MYSRPPLPPAGVPRRLPGSSSRLTPQRAAEIAERGARLPAGQGDRFSGYAVLGVPFASGDVLALRRYTASTLGPGYTSVWHRSPAGRWVFYSDVAPDQSCARYFGGAVDRTVVGAIRLDWPSPCRLQVVVPSRLDWVIDLALSPAAWLFNAATDAMPEPWWQSRRVLRALGLFAAWHRAGHVDRAHAQWPPFYGRAATAVGGDVQPGSRRQSRCRRRGSPDTAGGARGHADTSTRALRHRSIAARNTGCPCGRASRARHGRGLCPRLVAATDIIQRVGWTALVMSGGHTAVTRLSAISRRAPQSVR